MTLVPEIANNERPDLCAACGGACCRTRPGIEAPGRFLATSDPPGALARALASGWVLAEHVGVPWTNGVPPPDEDRYRLLHYPRPATLAEHRPDPARPAEEAAACVFLDPGGCRLAFEDRPRMCRSLEPAGDGDCVAAWDRRAAALAWLPHQDLVAAALALGERRTDAQEPRR